TFSKSPFMIQQKVQITVIPLRGIGGPGPFQPGSHRIFTVSFAFWVKPSQALRMNTFFLRITTQCRRVAITVTLTYCVPTNGKSCSFFIIHGHSAEGNP